MKKICAAPLVLMAVFSMFAVVPARANDRSIDRSTQQSAVKAWENTTSFGLENDHLLFVGDYSHYAYPTPNNGVWWEYLLFKDTGTTWTCPWGDIVCVDPSTYWADAGSWNIIANNGTDWASITVTYSTTGGGTTLLWTAEFWITNNPYVLMTLYARNTGSQTSQTIETRLGYATYIAGDTSNDYYYIPGVGERRYNGTQQNLEYSPTEPWLAAWDANKLEGVGVVFTQGYQFPPNRMHIHDWYGLTNVAQGGWAYSDVRQLQPGETSQAKKAYLYFYNGTGWQKTKDFYDSTLVPHLTLTPSTGIASTTVAGSGFSSNSRVTIVWNGTTTTSIPNPATTDATGNFVAMISIPTQTVPAVYGVNATDEYGKSATTTFTVVTLTDPSGTLDETQLVLIAFPTAASILALGIAVVALVKRKS